MITINELFSGLGAQVAAFKRLNIPCEVIGISEIDKYAIQSYEAINGPTRNYGDITQIERLDYADLWTYSSPCFTADSLVLTENRGFQKITDVKIGEKVVTHDGSYKTVENVINNGVKKTVKVYGMGIDEIHTTPNHLFYVREKSHVWNSELRSSIRTFSKPIWKRADSLKRTDYLGVPVNDKSEIPSWNGITFTWSDGRKDRYKNQLSQYMDNKDFWWLIGRYIADGWFRNNGGIIIGCGKKKFNEMKEKCDKLNINYTITEERTAFKFQYPLKELQLFVKPFGKYAYGKKIPSFVMNLPIHLLNSFIDGYMAGDGCFTNGRFKASSVSRELIYGLAQCIAKVYKQPYSIYKTKRPKTTIIEGRTVNQKDTYELCFKKTKCIQDKAFYENGFLWFPINKVEEADVENVYDLTVKENHSFTVQGVIVHNCQDFSTAGKQKGIYNADGSLTRSGLLLHVERLLTESVLYGTQPKYLLLENVKALVSKKFKPDFLNWLDKLEQLGYNNYWQVLNAKDYGIPQNRERVFVVSIRKDVDTKGYKFPSPVPLKLRLKDMLEPCVDEKYYLSADKVEKFTNALNKKIENQEVSYCIDANYWKGTTPQQFLNKNRRQLVKEVSNTIRCDGGGSLDGKHTWDIVVEPKRELKFKIKPNGDIRGYQNDTKNSSASEWQIYNENNISGALTTTHAPKVIQVGNIVSTGNWDNPQRGRIYSPSGCSPALNTCQGGGLEPKILEEGVGLNPLSRKLEFNGFKENCPSLRATDYKCPHCYSDGYRIRKLTPRECWRLMAFTDIEFDCAKLSGVSDSRLYQQAGNSIVVDVLVAIFRELFNG